MAELIILMVICVGLCGRRGTRWEWSRDRLVAALGSAAEGGERLLGRARRSLPGIVGQCLEDVHGLFDDMLGILDPGARSRIAKGTRSFLADAPGRARRLAGRPVAGSRLAGTGPTSAALAGGRGEASASAFACLQRRYLDGAISLEEYITESRRLGPPVRPG